MVKQAEKVKKRNPLLPVYGIIVAVGLFIVAFALVNPAIDLGRKFSPGLRLDGPDFSIGPSDKTDPNSPTKITFPSTQRLAVAFAIWLVLLAVAYTVVGILVGRDPESAKAIKLPPRKIDKNRLK
jgi:hypothetical protein